MRIHDLPGHTPSEEWLNKTDLAIYSTEPPRTTGYYIRHGNKGIIFWAEDGDVVIEYLMQNYAGFKVWVHCPFWSSKYGQAIGSEDKPVILEWYPTNQEQSNGR